MRLRRLGRTNLQVSELSLGTVELGMDYGIAAPGERLRPTEDAAAELLHYALDSGINFIDTARAYGESERIIGAALKARRHEYVLASKVKPHPGDPAKVKLLVEQSLLELQTDCIDIVLIHCGEEVTPCPDTTSALQQMRDEGKLRFIGSSTYGVEAALAAIQSNWFDCLEVAYSVLDRRPEAGVLEAARQRDVGIVARSVLLKGALTERYRLLPDALASLNQYVENLAIVAGSISALPALAYRYVLSQEPPHSVLVGTGSRHELSSCIEYTNRGALPPDQLRSARAAGITDEWWLNPRNWPA